MDRDGREKERYFRPSDLHQQKLKNGSQFVKFPEWGREQSTEGSIKMEGEYWPEQW